MAASVTIIKHFSWRGNTEEWSNRYHLTAAPSDDTAWKSLADALIALEKTIYPYQHVVVRAYGHTSDDDPAVWSYDYLAHSESVAGTLSISARYLNPGDVACWVRWDTGRNDSRGHNIYLRKYFHGTINDGTTPDAIADPQGTALTAFGEALLDPIDGSISMAGPDGNAPPGPVAKSAWATTRTLKRRGARPPT